MYGFYKLNESTKTSGPPHFNSLVENLILERGKLKEKNSEMCKCSIIEQELIYCVALTVALEVGFRFGISEHLTSGFDIRAMKELTSLVNFRYLNDSLKTILYLPRLNFWEFKVVSTPTCYDCALYNILALEDGQIRSTASIVIPCSKYIQTNSKDKSTKTFIGLEMFEDIKTLSEIFTNAFSRIRNDALDIVGVNNFNLLCLPDELKRVIFLKLGAKDFVNLCASSKVMWNCIKDEIIWRQFLMRDFAIVISEGCSPYHTYQAVAQQRLISTSFIFRYPNDSVHSDLSIELIERGHYS